MKIIFFYFLKIFCIFIFLTFCCCLPAQKISIQLKNQYSEKILNCQLGENYLGDLEKQAKTEIVFIEVGNYNFSCQTKSGFEISAKLNFSSKKKIVLIIINQNGKLELK